jgi:chromosome segregation protein
MRLKNLEINSFKSFSKKTVMEFESPIVSIVGPNGSGKSNVVESIRFVLGEQSMKSMRGKAGSDLIFKGSKTLPKGSSASVTIYFNNSDKIFKLSNENGEDINLNYDVISISREVYPDGLNKYILNGTEVRMKDINNLLASVNIGSSGHHIISQGEADRILNASGRDRKEMVEDALGLKVYQYKIKESERKLERTSNNMKEVHLLRREIAPHLKFLERQVEKIEKGKEMREELSNLYAIYFKVEENYISLEESKIKEDKDRIEKEIKDIEKEISALPVEIGAVNQEENELSRIEKRIFSIKSESGELLRKLGRIEGSLEAAMLSIKNKSYTSSEVENFFKKAKDSIKQALSKNELSALRSALEEIGNMIEAIDSDTENSVDLSELEKAKEEINKKLTEIEEEEKKLTEEIRQAKDNLEQSRENRSLANARRYEFNIKKTELNSILANIRGREETIRHIKGDFENETKEAIALLGSLFKKDTDAVPSELNKPELKKDIERLKIKLEDYGSIGVGETIKEYEDTKERDQFLTKETEDLEKSIESLKALIVELKEKIDFEFGEGIKKINKEFQEFFSLMFGGGTGSLSVVIENNRRRKNTDDEEIEIEEEDVVPEQGVEINVSLPHKKVKELHALSGGERSLTSIALLFAMSQVNPPPFLVLDETDAALDESNSRKYGDMLEKLSKHSQLIVVTHNRETMSRAGVLYGVTVGSDGASKLLSVKFEEATAIAK